MGSFKKKMMMKTCMLITLVSLVHPSPTTEMKIIIHLHEEPAPAPASEDTAGGSEAGSDYHYGTTFPNNGFQPPIFRGPMNPPIRRFPNFGLQPPNYQNPDIGCYCKNPFLGQRVNTQNGNPDFTCARGGYCYVDCNSNCRDIEDAKGFGRCYSKLACAPGAGLGK